MKPFSIRLPEEVCEKLKEMDKEQIRNILIKASGMVYPEENKLIDIKDIVRKYLEENLRNYNFTAREAIEEVQKDMTKQALDSILNIMN